MHVILLRSLLYMQSLDERRMRLKKARKKLLNKKSSPCRVCNKKRGVISIFQNSLQIDIALEIHNFSGVMVNKTDKESKSICKSCLELLEGCVKFRDLCRKNNEFLHNAPCKPEMQITEEATVNNDFESLETHDADNNVTSNVDDNYSLPSPTFSDDFKIHHCPTCDMPFPDLDKYNIHITQCDGTDLPELQICEEQPKRRFLCDICGKTISTLATLYIHMKIHKDVFPFHCDQCPYRGRTVDLLRVHKRTHLTEKPYKCTLCPKTATTASNLQRHMRNAHSTNRPYKCDYCDRSYRLQRDVTRHIRVAHSQQKTANCPICDKTLSSLNALSKHRLKVHKIKGRNGRMPSYLQCEMAQEMEIDYN